MTKRKNKKLFVATLLAVPAAVVVADDMKVSANTGGQEETVVVPGNYPQIQSSGARAMTLFSASPAASITVGSDTDLKRFLELQMGQFEAGELSVKYTTADSASWTPITIKNSVESTMNKILNDANNRYIKGTYNGYQYTFNYEGKTANIKIKINYLTTINEESATSSLIRDLASGLIGSTATDFEKVKAVHDHIITTKSYTSSNINNKTPHSLHTILTENINKGSAQAYALLAYRLLKELGVGVDYVTGTVNGTRHIWNLVEIDGKWYHLDTMMDDTSFSGIENSTNNTISYKNFLLTPTSERVLDSDQNHSTPLATASDTRFLAINTIQSALQVGGSLYYTHYYPDTTKPSLNKLTLTGLSSTTIKSDIEAKYIQNYKQWLYFSDVEKAGRLYKLPINPTSTTDPATLIVDETITSLKIASSTLTYVTASGRTGTINLEKNDPAVEEADRLLKIVEKATEDADLNYKIIQALVAIEALDIAQQALIKNEVAVPPALVGIDRIDRLQTLAKQRRVIDDTSVDATHANKIMKLIEELSSSDEDFVINVVAARTAYNSADPTNQNNVKNLEKLVSAEVLRATFVTSTTNWHELVANFNDNTSYAAIIAARTVYDKMSIAQRRKNIDDIFYSKLTTQEGKMATEKKEAYLVDYQLQVLNDNLETYINDVVDARADYTKLETRQQAVVTESLLTTAESKSKTYKQQARDFADVIVAWPATPTSAQIELARTQYNGFNGAIRGYIKILDDNIDNDFDKVYSKQILDTLNTGIGIIAIMDDATLAIAKRIDALNEETMTESDVNGLEQAIVELGTTKFDTIPSETRNNWATIKKKVLDAVIDAAKVTTQIDSLDSSPTENNITDAENAYNALIGIAKGKISEETKTKLAVYVLKRDVLKVDRLIDEASATPLVENKVVEARAAFEKLPAASKIDVKNLGMLEELEADVVEAKITALDSATLTEALLKEVRKALNDLTLGAVAKIADSFKELLEDKEKEYIEQAIRNLNSLSSLTDIEKVRDFLKSLTPGAKAKVDPVLIKRLNDLDDLLVDVPEKAAAKLVNEAIIAAYPNIAIITREEYNALLAKYTALSTKAQTYVTEKAKLDELKTAVEAKEIDIEKAKKEADPVIKLINALTSRSSADDLKKARDAYTALSPAAQKVVQDEDVLKKLEDFEKALTEKEKEATDKAAEEKARAEAREVEIKINAISETSTLEEVKAADVAYTGLSDLAKTFVSASAKSKLESLLAAKEKEYKETHGKAQVEAKVVSDRIDKITTATTVKELQSIRRAYDALSELAKTYVTNIAKLTSSEVYQEQQAKIVAAAKNEAAAFDTYMADLTRNSTTAEIAKARAFYNNLSAEAKKHSKTLEKLIKLETMWSDPDYIDLYLNYYPHYTDQQPTGGIEITAPKPDPLFIPDTVATTNAGPGEIAMDYRDGNYTATVFATDAPGSTKSKLTLTSSNNVKVSIPKKDILALKKLPVTVSTAVGYKSVTISFTEGYTAKTFSDFVEIKVPISELGANSKSVILCKLPNGQYEKASYQVLDGAFVIKTKVGATFVVEDKSTTAPTTTASTGYKDINSSANSTYINELAKLGIVSGGTASNYYPSQNITRGDFAIMIARAANLTTSTTTSLTDVRNTANASLIEALNESGIMRGTTSTRFSMSGTITREEASVILARLFRHLKMDVATMQNEQQTNYRDIANLSYESRRSIALMDLLEIFDSSATAFKPTAKLTRGEFAKVLSKAMEAAELK